MTTTVIAPGRLGNPGLEMRGDPRADPRMIAALAPFGLDGAGAPAPVAATGPRADRLEFALAGEAGFEAVFAALVDGLPEVDVERATETIEGGDGNRSCCTSAGRARLRGRCPACCTCTAAAW